MSLMWPVYIHNALWCFVPMDTTSSLMQPYISVCVVLRPADNHVAPAGVCEHPDRYTPCPPPPPPPPPVNYMTVCNITFCLYTINNRTKRTAKCMGKLLPPPPFFFLSERIFLTFRFTEKCSQHSSLLSERNIFFSQVDTSLLVKHAGGAGQQTI